MATVGPAGSMEANEMKIYFIRGQRVMLDSDLARIYGVTTKRLKEQFRRNRNRFPNDFAFPLTREELANLRSQIATSSSHGGQRYLPIGFTEHGAIMLASVLNSDKAVEMSVFVVRAFVEMREMLTSNRQLAAKLEELESRVGAHDEAIAELVSAIRELLSGSRADEPGRQIGFHVREQVTRYRTSNRN